MLGDIFARNLVASSDLLTSRLFDERTFYKAFLNDLRHCQSDVLIESPFITGNRVAGLLPIFKKMASSNIRITINTRHPDEHDSPYNAQAWAALEILQEIGVEVLFTGRHHRKLAIFDRRVLWEGSLNILSQNDSCEIMRRTQSSVMAQQMIRFIKLNNFL